MTAPHFLVPVDFSPSSEQALAYAMALAAKLQARVTVLHVIDRLPMAERYAAVSPRPNRVSAYLQNLEAEVQQRLDAQHKQIQEAGLAGKVLMTHGVPSQTIVAIARDKHVDLIVMGTHGRTGVHHLLMGSVAEKVVRLAPCPVLVTRAAPEIAVP
jgi:nucleotide-binding universal stress UspA family protein